MVSRVEVMNKARMGFSTHPSPAIPLKQRES